MGYQNATSARPLQNQKTSVLTRARGSALKRRSLMAAPLEQVAGLISSFSGRPPSTRAKQQPKQVTGAPCDGFGIMQLQRVGKNPGSFVCDYGLTCRQSAGLGRSWENKLWVGHSRVSARSH